MSYNPNFYNNFAQHNTFQTNIMPPPPPPPQILFPAQTDDIADKKVIQSIEAKLPSTEPKKPKPTHTVSISQVREQIREMLFAFNMVKNRQDMLANKINTMSDDVWKSNVQEIKQNQDFIQKTLTDISNYMEVLRKLLAKRSAKRMRLKRLRSEKKREKEEYIKESEERSRKIDENLQKIKDDINRTKQEEEAKIEADIVLKDVLRKKHDAKKCLVKLDALIRLRKARQNTAKGRGEVTSDQEACAFNSNIDKLKSLWTQRLAAYEKEEADLRAKLKEDTAEVSTATQESEKEVAGNLAMWCDVLFGGSLPQVSFKGELDKFVDVRSSWDQLVDSEEGTPLPVGWVLPSAKPL